MMRIHNSSFCNVRYIFIAIAMVLYSLYNFYLCKMVVAAGAVALMNPRTIGQPRERVEFSLALRSKENGAITNVDVASGREAFVKYPMLVVEFASHCESEAEKRGIDPRVVPWVMLASLPGRVDPQFLTLARLLWYYEEAVDKVGDVSVEAVRQFIARIGQVSQYEVIVISGESHAKMRAMSEAVTKTLNISKKSARMTKQQMVAKIKRDAENLGVPCVYKPCVWDLENTDSASFSHPQLLDPRVLNIVRALGNITEPKSNISPVPIEGSHFIVVVLQELPEKKSVDLATARALCKRDYVHTQVQKLTNAARMNFSPLIEERGIVCDEQVYDWESIACLLNVMMYSAGHHEIIVGATMREEMVKNPELFAKSLGPVCDMVAVSHYGRQSKASISEEELHLRAMNFQLRARSFDRQQTQAIYDAMPVPSTAAYQTLIVVSRNKLLMENFCRAMKEAAQKASQDGLDPLAKKKVLMAACSSFLAQYGEAISKTEWISSDESYHPIIISIVENAVDSEFNKHAVEFNPGMYCACLVLKVQGPGQKLPKEEIVEKLQRLIISRKIKEWFNALCDTHDVIVTTK